MMAFTHHRQNATAATHDHVAMDLWLFHNVSDFYWMKEKKTLSLASVIKTFAHYKDKFDSFYHSS